MCTLAGTSSAARLDCRAGPHQPAGTPALCAAQENGASSKAYFYKVMYTCAQIGRPPREGTAGDQ